MADTTDTGATGERSLVLDELEGRYEDVHKLAVRVRNRRGLRRSNRRAGQCSNRRALRGSNRRSPQRWNRRALQRSKRRSLQHSNRRAPPALAFVDFWRWETF